MFALGRLKRNGQYRHVVSKLAVDPSAHERQEPANDLLGTTTSGNRLLNALLAEELLAASGFGDAIRIEQDHIALAELHGFFPICDIGDGAE